MREKPDRPREECLGEQGITECEGDHVGAVALWAEILYPRP